MWLRKVRLSLLKKEIHRLKAEIKMDKRIIQLAEYSAKDLSEKEARLDKKKARLEYLEEHNKIVKSVK